MRTPHVEPGNPSLTTYAAWRLRPADERAYLSAGVVFVRNVGRRPDAGTHDHKLAASTAEIYVAHEHLWTPESSSYSTRQINVIAAKRESKSETQALHTMNRVFFMCVARNTRKRPTREALAEAVMKQTPRCVVMWLPQTRHALFIVDVTSWPEAERLPSCKFDVGSERGSRKQNEATASDSVFEFVTSSVISERLERQFGAEPNRTQLWCLDGESVSWGWPKYPRALCGLEWLPVSALLDPTTDMTPIARALGEVTEFGQLVCADPLAIDAAYDKATALAPTPAMLTFAPPTPDSPRAGHFIQSLAQHGSVPPKTLQDLCGEVIYVRIGDVLPHCGAARQAKLTGMLIEGVPLPVLLPMLEPGSPELIRILALAEGELGWRGEFA